MANANRKQSELEKGSLCDSIGHRLHTRQRCTPPIATEYSLKVVQSDASGQEGGSMGDGEGRGSC